MIPGCSAYDLIVVVGTERDADADTVNNSQDTPTSTLTSTAATPALIISCSECMFRFGTIYSSSDEVASRQKQEQNYSVYIVVHDQKSGNTLRLPISSHNTIQQSQVSSTDTDNTSQQLHVHDPIALQQIVNAFCADNVSDTNGPFNANFILQSSNEEEGIIGIAPFHIYLYHKDMTNLAIVDVDGTITTSTLSGFWNTAILHDYSPNHCHAGVCQFFNHFVTRASSTPTVTTTTRTTNTTTSNSNDDTNGNALFSKSSIQLLYLTNRPISYVEATRNLLLELKQDNYQLPRGPLIGFCGGLAGVFKMDFYHVNAHEFKYETLQKYVIKPFTEIGAEIKNIMYAGFGNTLYDMHAYHHSGIDLHRMFIIDKKSRIYCCDATTALPDKKVQNDNRTKQRNGKIVLDHPKQYESVKGTKFSDGYKDPELISHIINLDQR